MAKNLLDLMPEEDKQKALDRASKRLSKRTGKVSPEMYTIAEAGYYFGWEAIVSIKRGYIDYHDKDGNYKQSILTLEEVNALVEAARKVWYGKVVDQAAGNFNATVSSWSKTPGQSFKGAMQPFLEEAEL